MPRYIPFDKMQKLREAAKNGDERAKKILRAQLDDVDDFSADLEDYFKPAPEEPVEDVATANPEEVKQEETQQIIAQQNPTNLITGQQTSQAEISQKILDLISSCDKQTLEIVNNPELSDATKKGALSIIGEIKQSCLDNLEKFGKLMSSISKKQTEEEI